MWPDGSRTEWEERQWGAGAGARPGRTINYVIVAKSTLGPLTTTSGQEPALTAHLQTRDDL